MIVLRDTLTGHDQTRLEEYLEGVDLEAIDLKAVNMETVDVEAVNVCLFVLIILHSAAKRPWHNATVFPSAPLPRK
jgi:hypothetical protein